MKIPEKEIDLYRALYEQGVTYSKIALMYGRSNETVRRYVDPEFRERANQLGRMKNAIHREKKRREQSEGSTP